MHFPKWAEGLILGGSCRILICQQLPVQHPPLPPWQNNQPGALPAETFSVLERDNDIGRSHIGRCLLWVNPVRSPLLRLSSGFPLLQSKIPYLCHGRQDTEGLGPHQGVLPYVSPKALFLFLDPVGLFVFAVLSAWTLVLSVLC